MAYIGRQLTSGNYLKLDDISSQFNGSTTQFNLTSGGQAFYPGSPFSILVSLAGIIQEPDSSYQINESTITFAIAPQASDDFFCIALGTSLGIGVPGEQTVTGTKLSKPFNYDNGLLYLDDTNDYIGIGTDNPQSKLQVDGKVRVGGATTFTEDLVVTGDARVTGILTIGTGSITLDPNAKKISGIDEILIGEVGTANTITIKQNNGRVEFRDILGKERQVSIGTDVSINTTGIITSSTLNVGTGITLSGTQINVGSATTIHTTGFQIGTSFLHSSGLDLGSGNIISHNINSTGIITAASFSGDGSALTGIDATALKDSGGNVKVQANESGVFITGVATATSFSGDGSALTGITAGATLSDSSGSERVVLTGQTSGTMTATSTSSNLTFNSSTNTLSSSTFSGSLSAAADQAIVNQHNGNSSQWYGRILSKNSTNDRAAFLGTYGSIAGVFAHNNALSAWADLYVNTVDGSGGGTVRLPSSVLVNGSQVWHAGNDGSGSGLDADVLDGYDSSSYLNKNGTSYFQLTTWLESTGGHGFYSPNSGAGTHFYPGDLGDYGAFRASGSKGGWGGFSIEGTQVFMGRANNDCGIYNDQHNHWMFYASNNGASVMYWAGNDRVRADSYGAFIYGELLCNGNITAYYSDGRLKENYRNIESPIEKINQLNGYVFDWNQKAKDLKINPCQWKDDVGLIAQEVQKVYPQAVALAPFDITTNEDNEKVSKSGEDYLTVQYERLVPLLVEAIKEQHKTINKLEKDIEDLKTKIGE